MPPQSTSLRTLVTDDILNGQMAGMDVPEPTENQKTLLLEVHNKFAIQLSWVFAGATTLVVGGGVQTRRHESRPRSRRPVPADHPWAACAPGWASSAPIPPSGGRYTAQNRRD